MHELLSRAVDIVRSNSDSESERLEAGLSWLGHGFRESKVVDKYYAAYPEDLPSGATVDGVTFGAIVHDIGKVTCVTDPRIWTVQSWKINEFEQQEIAKHPKEGLRLLAEFERAQGIEIPSEAYQYVGLHHERLDGSGLYHLPADQLGEVARLAAVIDKIVSRCENRIPRYENGPTSFFDAYHQVNALRDTFYDGYILDTIWELYKDNPYIYDIGNEWIFHGNNEK